MTTARYHHYRAHQVDHAGLGSVIAQAEYLAADPRGWYLAHAIWGLDESCKLSEHLGDVVIEGGRCELRGIEPCPAR